MTTASELQAKLERIQLLEKKLELQNGLPHLHGLKMYPWMRDFFESRSKDNFICASNQVGKSSINIRKCIHWATAKELWPELWHSQPRVFWYLYPARDVATVELEKKWIPEFLPRGKFQDDPVFGWKVEYRSKFVNAIHFNSGVSVYFKTYAQDAQNLQTGTCHAIFSDEELPEHLYDELNLRRAATDGYFHLVFTATLGQELWRLAIEGRGKDKRFPDAFKRQVSMYDCLYYEDGTRAHWTKERIRRIEASCKSPQEVQRRVYGRFVQDSGLRYPSFNRDAHVINPFEVDRSWVVYSGVDVGSGGDNHPAAISFIAVRPDFQYGVVFRGWRGTGQTTTASDVVNKFLELSMGLNPVANYYDYSSRDFYTIASRLGCSFTPAEKSHEHGEQILNVLFKNDMLHVFDLPELESLATELSTLNHRTDKTKAKDDFIDATRYAAVRIPWNFEAVQAKEFRKKPVQGFVGIIGVDEMARNDLNYSQDSEFTESIEAEFEAWNELHEV